MADSPSAPAQRFFVDREDSLQSMNLAYRRLAETSENQVVFILGEAGIGKTSLVERFLSLIDNQQAFVLTARGYEEQSSPLFPFVEMVKGFLSSYKIVDRKYVLDSVLNLTKLVPMLEPVVGPIQQMVKDTRGLSDVDKYSVSSSYIVFSNYLSMIKKIGAKKPVIIHVDDAQWLDGTSFELLSYLIKKGVRNVLAIISYRTGYITSTRESDSKERLEVLLRNAGSNCTVLELKSLDESLYPQFISGLLGPHGMGRPELKQLFGHTGGNPFYLKSTIDVLLESGSMTRGADGLWSLAEGQKSRAGDALPKSLQETVMRMLRRAYSDVPGSREILSYASVIGYRFRLGMLGDFLKKDKLEIHHILQELEDRFSIVRTIDGGETYLFEHRNTQEAIYRSLGSVAADCHAKIAGFLESRYDPKDASRDPFAIAYHYRKAGDSPNAVKFLKLSAEAAFGSHFYSDAVAEYEECFALAQQGRVSLSQQETGSLRLGYCRALLGVNKLSECIVGLDELLRSGSLTGQQAAEARLVLGRCYRMEGRADSGTKAISMVESSLESFEKLGDAQRLGEVYSYLATVYDHFGQFDRAVRAFEQSQICYNRAGDLSGLARLQRKSGMIFESRRALAFMANALGTFDRYSMKIEKARCLNNIGAESFYIGDFANAERNLSLSLELFRTLDSPEVDIPLNNLALVYQQRGYYDRSMKFLEDAHDNVSEPFNDIFICMNMANNYRKTGRMEKARQIVVHLEPSVTQYREPVMNDYYGFNRAMIHRELGEVGEAEAWLTKFEPNGYKKDDELVLAKRFRAMAELLQRIGGSSDMRAVEELKAKSAELFSTARPQKWFYELDYYPCDIHIWD